MSFEFDIQQRNTNLVPVVDIHTLEAGGGIIHISTNNIMAGEVHYSPILENVPAIKESIDLESRRYKISNVTLNIFNHEVDGVRFSDLYSGSLINKEVEIGWTSPSLIETYLSGGTQFTTIFRGVIRKYDMSTAKIRITVEDRSQSLIHKDLPLPNEYDNDGNVVGVQRWLGTGDDVPDKYKSKPIPMIYGHVDRSPCVLTGTYDAEIDYFKTTRFIIDSNQYGVASKIETEKNIGNKTLIETPLYLENSGNFFNCSNEGNESNDISNFMDYDNGQGFIDLNLDNTIENSSNLGIARLRILREPRSISPIYIGAGGDGNIGNRFTHLDGNETLISEYLYDNNYATGWTLLMYGIDGPGDYDSGDNYTDYNSFIYYTTSDSNEHEAAYVNIIFPTLYSDFECTSQLFLATSFQNANTSSADTILALHAWTGSVVPSYNVRASMLSAPEPTWDNFPNAVVQAMSEQESANEDDYSGEGFEGGWNLTSIIPTFSIPGDFSIGFPFHTDIDYSGSFGCAIKDFKMLDMVLYQNGYSEDLNKYNFYVNAVGLHAMYDATPSAVNVIKGIFTAIGQQPTFVDEYEYYDWRYDFTINEKINSRKILEDISSVSPFIPHLNSQGEARLDVIHETYSEEEIASATPIKEADCISFSYSLTDISKVYTKIELKYNYNYAIDEFSDIYSVSTDSDEMLQVADYDPAYYGFPLDHSESTLVIDDDRGKYIRKNDPDDSVPSQGETAKAFAKWTLLWHCNQHLKIKIRLPLKYMQLEVGSMCSFDKVLGDVKPYGIDYDPQAAFGGINIGDVLNFQQIFPIFMCVESSKTLEYCDFTLMQMHNLSDEYVTRDAIQGCMDPEAWNFLPDADYPGNCWTFGQYKVGSPGEADSCPFEANPLGGGDPSDVGETDIPYADWSTNYPNTGVNLSDPGVFLASDSLQNYTNPFTGEVETMHPAQVYWLQQNMPEPGAANAPQIWDYQYCSWQDSVYHELDRIKMSVYDGNLWQTMEPTYIYTDPETTEYDIEITFSQAMIDYVLEVGQLEMRIHHFFVLNDPTYAGNSTFEQRYINNNTGSAYYNYLLEAVASSNVYLQTGDEPQEGYFVESINLPLNILDFQDGEDNHVLAKLGLYVSPIVSPDEESNYYEIGGLHQGDSAIKVNMTFKGYTEEEPPDGTLGDYNGDGIVNVLDIVQIMNLILATTTPTEEQLAAADMNDDGIINILDLVQIMQIIIG